MNIKNFFYWPHTTHEIWQQDASGLTWTYVDKGLFPSDVFFPGSSNPREYQVISRKDKTIVKFDIKGKYNAELTLDGGPAQHIQNLLKKIESVHVPIRPIPPIKPMAPLILSFDSAATQEKKSNEYSKELESYIGESQKYDVAMINYEAKVSSYRLNETQHEKNRKDLLKIIDTLFEDSIVLLRKNKIPC